MSHLRLLLLLLVLLAGPSYATTLWTTGRELMPAWGFYPNGSEYGNTPVLGEQAAWGSGTLTWVVDMPASGTYHVWVRRYGGYGSVEALINEQPVSGGRGGSQGPRYVWRHLGAMELQEQTYHLDLLVRGCMFDAVLLTTDPDFDPAVSEADLPPPFAEPVRRAPRTWRDDSHLQAAAGERGFVLALVDDLAEPLNDLVPLPPGSTSPVGPTATLADSLTLIGAPGQIATRPFAIRALHETGPLTVRLDTLQGAEGSRLDAEAIDLRVVHLRRRTLALFSGQARAGLMADLLLRDDRTALPPEGHQGGFGGSRCSTAIPAHESRQFLLAVQLGPDTPPGTYRGTLQIEAASGNLEAPVQLQVAPVELATVEGWYGLYYPAQTTRPERDHHVTEAQYLAALQDMVRLGSNAVTLYGGVDTLELAAEAGLTEAPIIMGWPDSTAPTQIARAREAGFPDLYYYGVDEPRGEQAIERSRREAQRRLEAGLHMFAALNSHQAWEALHDVVDRPVLNIYVFDATSDAAARARSHGHRPLSYWVTSISWPLYYRALGGLYNVAAGYAGTAPWAYADFTDERNYAEDRHIHAVAYPDEAGLPIPTLRWHAFREGIDDVRYLQALDRALETARERLGNGEESPELTAAIAQATATREHYIEPIGGRWFGYINGLKPQTLPETQAALRESTAALQAALREPAP